MMRSLELEHLGLEVLGLVDDCSEIIIGIVQGEELDVSDIYINTEDGYWYCNDNDTTWEFLI